MWGCVQVDEWLDFSPSLCSGAGLDSACKFVDAFLATRTLLVGVSVTLADIMCWGQLQGQNCHQLVCQESNCICSS